MPKKTTYAVRVVKTLGSSGFFWLIMALLVLQAAWIALTGRYPMAFDEDYHVGIIKLYAHHISPFWSGQPAGADRFGAVARDPSYLYQYLMSFPYRLISLFAHSQTIQVLWLRAINIGLFVASLPLYRRLLLKTGASRTLVNACMLLFVLLPITPLLASQINYDNLLLPVVAASLLLTVEVGQEIRRIKPVNWQKHAALLTLCLLGCLVKYAFLAVALAEAAYLVVLVVKYRQLWTGLKNSLRRAAPLTFGLWLTVIVVSGGLFVERYGINVARYHTMLPNCDQVLTVKQCSNYGPWIRDFILHTNKAETKDPVTAKVVEFTGDWFYGIWLRTFFAVDGPATLYQTRGPLVLPAVSAIVLAVIATLAAIWNSERLFKRYDSSILALFLTVGGIYVAALWIDEFRAFLHTSQPVAINGRYLLPVLLPLFIVGALALNDLALRLKLKIAILATVFLCFIWGGGALTYILRSNDQWYWPNPAVKTANHALQRTLGPITPGYRNPTLWMGRN